jgi:hypothetical protein
MATHPLFEIRGGGRGWFWGFLMRRGKFDALTILEYRWIGLGGSLVIL